MDIIETNFADYDGIRRHPWEISRCRFLGRLLQRCFAGKKQLKVLDIGSGDCFFLKTLATQYPEYHFTAIDTGLDDNQLSQLRNRLPDNVTKIFNRWESMPENEQFDAVIMLDVLEHIEDDAAFLQKLKTGPILRDGGLVFLTVPALQCLFSNHDRLLKHYRRYSRKELNAKIRNAGFTVRHSAYFFASLLPLRMAGKLLHNSKRQNLAVDQWNGSRFLTALISFLLYTDAMCGYFLSKLKINTPGLSCFLIAQK